MSAKFSHFAEKIVFWSTLDAPSEKTVQLQELAMIVKVVVNNIVDIQFDQYAVRSNAKELYQTDKRLESLYHNYLSYNIYSAINFSIQSPFMLYLLASPFT